MNDEQDAIDGISFASALAEIQRDARKGEAMNKKKSGNFWESFHLAVELGEYAEEQKRKLAVGTTEQAYWQGTADACRKICSAMRGDKLWSELYQELGKAER